MIIKPRHKNQQKQKIPRLCTYSQEMAFCNYRFFGLIEPSVCGTLRWSSSLFHSWSPATQEVRSPVMWIYSPGGSEQQDVVWPEGLHGEFVEFEVSWGKIVFFCVCTGKSGHHVWILSWRRQTVSHCSDAGLWEMCSVHVLVSSDLDVWSFWGLVQDITTSLGLKGIQDHGLLLWLWNALQIVL